MPPKSEFCEHIDAATENPQLPPSMSRVRPAKENYTGEEIVLVQMGGGGGLEQFSVSPRPLGFG